MSGARVTGESEPWFASSAVCTLPVWSSSYILIVMCKVCIMVVTCVCVCVRACVHVCMCACVCHEQLTETIY